MLALRLICPAGLTPGLVEVLRNQPGATHLVHLPGAALEPPGDVLLADLARSAVSEIVDALRAVSRGG